MTGLIVAIVDRRPPGRRWWLGAGVALAGEALLVLSRFGVPAHAQGSLWGDLVVLVSCVASSGGYVAGARLARAPAVPGHHLLGRRDRRPSWPCPSSC